MDFWRFPMYESCWKFNFSDWLLQDEGIVFRDYSPPFLKEMADWMTTIANLLRPYMAPNGGPIILAQVENEYGTLKLLI